MALCEMGCPYRRPYLDKLPIKTITCSQLWYLGSNKKGPGRLERPNCYSLPGASGKLYPPSAGTHGGAVNSPASGSLLTVGQGLGQA